MRTRPVRLAALAPLLLAVCGAPAGDAASGSAEGCLADAFPKTRDDFPALLKCLGLSERAVEVGVQAGVHARAFLDSWDGRHLKLVDKWSSDGDDSNLFYVDIANIQGLDVRRQHRIHCEQRLADMLRSGRAEIHNLDSVAAAAQVADGELDFVYLDARHDFAGVVRDIRAWWPKVRVGGIFAGHDFVDGEFPEGDFFWISALREVLPGLENSTHITKEVNRYPSFFIIKSADMTSLSPREFEEEDIARKLYANSSRYFGLWRESGAWANGEASFLAACEETCGRDCEVRVREFTPHSVAGSTLRPFACRDTSGQEAGAGGQEASDVCAAEMLVDVKAYHDVCIERCKVTCQQRHELFASLGSAAGELAI